MSPQQIAKWVFYILAIVAFLLPGAIGPFDHIMLAFFLLINAIFWQGEPK